MTGIQQTTGGGGSPASTPRPSGTSAPTAPTAPPGGPGAARHAAEPSIGELVAQASEQLSILVRSEVELAKLELRRSVKNAGAGGGMFAGAGVVLAFSLTFGFTALALGLYAAGLYLWLAFLVVFVAQLIVVGLLSLLGTRKVKRIKAPERTIETSKETVAYLRNHG